MTGPSGATRPRPSPRPGATAPRPPWPVTRRCWSPRPPSWASRTSTGCWPIGSSWPTPTGPTPQTRSARPRATSSWRPSFSGMWLGQMTLDPISGSIVSNELNRLEHDLFEADCAEAKERLGRTGRIDELARTSGQRRADALVEMATRSRTAPAEGIRPAPLFTVFVGYETLHGRICELENGTVLHPRPSSPWMDSAYFERALFSLGQPDRRQRAGSRFFTGGTRRAIELRDRICTHPHCYEPAENCQVDHIETYASGGRDHPGQRPAALWLPQPPAQPARGQPASSASGPHRAPPEGAARSPGPVRPGSTPARFTGRHFENRSTSGALARPRVRARPGADRRPTNRQSRRNHQRNQRDDRGALADGWSRLEPASPRTVQCVWLGLGLLCVSDPIQNGIAIRTRQRFEHRLGLRIGDQGLPQVLGNLDRGLPGVGGLPPAIRFRLLDLVFA